MSDKGQWDAGASYAGLAVQMGVIIAIGAYGGVRLDRWLNLSPLFTIVCALLSIALAMYVMVFKLTKKKEENKHQP